MSAAARAAAEVAGTLAGSVRHLAMVPPDERGPPGLSRSAVGTGRHLAMVPHAERRRFDWSGAAAVNAFAGGAA